VADRSRRGKKAIRDELASEERCVEQRHHEESLLGSSELQCACRVAPLDGESWF